MPSLTAPFFASLLALAALAGQTAPDDTESARLRLESQRRELLASVEDKVWMQDQSRATLARLRIEQNWKACAENEAQALAKASERPARLIAESALTNCQPWHKVLALALDNGAYPYVDGAESRGRISRDDMVEGARLASLDAALARIRTWRGSGRASAKAAATPPAADPGARIEFKPRPIPERLAPPDPVETPEAPAASAGPAEETVIVVTGRRKRGCQVRLADRTLSEAELAAKAREWAASGTALKVVRPRGADYRCMAKIAWQLGQQGLRFFEFVDAP